MIKKAFLNFRYDKQFQPFQDVLFYSALRGGFAPHVAAMSNPQDTNRVGHINRLIRGCEISVHDLTLSYSDNRRLPKLNMAFELGMAYSTLLDGCRVCRGKRACKKCDKRQILVLVEDESLVPEYISDLTASPHRQVGIFSHKQDLAELIGGFRDFSQRQQTSSLLPGKRSIVREFEDYQRNLPRILEQLRIDKCNLTLRDQMDIIYEWIKYLQP